MIPVRNVYYMLSYAFQALRNREYKKIEGEEFENIFDLYAAILVQGMKLQIKRGIWKEYVPKTEMTSTPKGHIDVSASIKGLTVQRRQLVCEYDEFTENNSLNQTIKAALLILLQKDTSRKKEIRTILGYLVNVDNVDPKLLKRDFRYNRTNQSYEMMIGISWMVFDARLLSTSEGNRKNMMFRDEQKMSHLYEKFILEYYRQEHKDTKADASIIPWNLDDGVSDYLPGLVSDVMLHRNGKCLIIDAKFYSATLLTNREKKMIHPDNIRQIYTYVKNQQAKESEPVSGMLLYAGTDEEIVPDIEYSMSGNKIAVRTLDLNQEFAGIRKELDVIVEKYLN